MRWSNLRCLAFIILYHKAKDITPSITWGREVWKEETLNDFHKWMREGCHLPNKHWNCFKDNTGEPAKRWGGVYIWAFLSA